MLEFKVGYMCTIDWEHEFVVNNKGSCDIYGSIEALKANHEYVDNCGIVKVCVQIVGVVQEPKPLTDTEKYERSDEF